MKKRPPSYSASAAERRRRAEDDELGLRVEERTAELAMANEALRIEITEHKRAEEALRESEERFRKVFEEGPLGMVMASPTNGQFLRANAAFCRMLGYAEEELKRLTFVEVTHPEHRSADVEAVNRLWEGQIPRYSIEKRYLKKKGEAVWARLVASLIRDQEGKARYIFGDDKGHHGAQADGEKDAEIVSRNHSRARGREEAGVVRSAPRCGFPGGGGVSPS